MRLFSVLLALATVGTASHAVAQAKALWVVNMSSVEASLQPLFKTVQGVVNREAAVARIVLVGLAEDDYKEGDVNAAAESLGFIRQHYASSLEYSAARVLADPWDLFSKPVVGSTATHLVLCSTDDAPQSLYAALTLASVHGKAAAVCASPEGQANLLKRTGLVLLRNISGMFPLNQSTVDDDGDDDACGAVNLFVEAAAKKDDATGAPVLSREYFGTWGIELGGLPTQGFDFAAKERMLVMCLDSGASDWSTTQTRLLRRYAPLSLGWGWWTKEDQDIQALSLLGLSFLGGGDNVALYSSLPPLTGGAQPGSGAALPNGSSIPASASLVVFSFSQGDTCSFNQKFNANILKTMSATDPSKRIAERFSFSLMETPLDTVVQANVAEQIRAEQNSSSARQFLLGKPYGYASPTALDVAGELPAYLAAGKKVLDLSGMPDVMVTENPGRLNATCRKMASIAAPWLRSIVIKHPVAYPQVNPDATEPARVVGRGATAMTPGSGVVLLSDPVHAASDKATNDIDVKKTIAQTLASAKARRFFYVFLDHQMTAGPLEQVLDVLTRDHSDEVYIVNFDQAFKLCAADPAARRCYVDDSWK